MRQHGGGREHRVREIAYFLWQREGHPHGEDERHWIEAEALYESEDADRKAIEGEPPGDVSEPGQVKAPPPEKIKPAASAKKAEPMAAKPAPASARPVSTAKVAAKRAESPANESASAKAPSAPKRKP